MVTDGSEKRSAYSFGIYLDFLRGEDSESKHQRYDRTSWPVEKAWHSENSNLRHLKFETLKPRRIPFTNSEHYIKTVRVLERLIRPSQGLYLQSTVQLKCDATRWRTEGEVKGKLANGVGSQYSSHYLGTWCIQHYYRWCAHLGWQQVDCWQPRCAHQR